MKFIHELNLYSSQIFYKFSISIRYPRHPRYPGVLARPSPLLHCPSASSNFVFQPSASVAVYRVVYSGSVMLSNEHKLIMFLRQVLVVLACFLFGNWLAHIGAIDMAFSNLHLASHSALVTLCCPKSVTLCACIVLAIISLVLWLLADETPSPAAPTLIFWLLHYPYDAFETLWSHSQNWNANWNARQPAWESGKSRPWMEKPLQGGGARTRIELAIKYELWLPRLEAAIRSKRDGWTGADREGDTWGNRIEIHTRITKVFTADTARIAGLPAGGGR